MRESAGGRSDEERRIIMVKNAITVFARVRPEKNRRGMVNYKIHRRPRKHSDEDFLVLSAPHKTLEYVDNRPETWNFSFHRIFGHEVRQDDIFENVARPIIDSVFDGYNATIFAYGQTGSGKTYTIGGELGIHAERGIIPRTLQYIFDTVRKNPENLYSVEIAYLEIYNENGYDLLLEQKQREAAPRFEDLPRVTIQEDENGAMHLKNLSFRVVENENEALRFLIEGDNYRAISETPMNPRSSRSHCIFTIVVSVKKFGADRYSNAKMHLVDLAGSERVYKCAIQGTILTEAKYINLSLHFLEQVIVSLGQENVSHVPYRNSLLTSILRDSLGGNCLTTMLANLSVSNFNLEETISTCRFAQRVALVRNDVNLTFKTDARSENKLLRMENARLREQIEGLKKRSIGEVIGTNGDTGSAEYYKNLVLQRDQEISRLLDMLKRARCLEDESIVEEGRSSISTEISRDQKATQVPSARGSPRKILAAPSPMRGKARRESINSLRTKSRRSPRVARARRKIEQEIESLELEIPEVPGLILQHDYFEPQGAEDFSGPGTDRETSGTGKNDEPAIPVEIDEIESPKRAVEGTRTNESPLSKSCRKNRGELEKWPGEEKSPGKNSTGDKSPGFPRNVMKMIRASCTRQWNENSTPKSASKTPNILRNMLCIEKNSVEDTRAQMDGITGSNEVNEVEKNFGKLPLTGDPEIDEEILAFYRAKRGGGTY